MLLRNDIILVLDKRLYNDFLETMPSLNELFYHVLFPLLGHII